MAYGFDLEPTLHAQLRAPVPLSALAWVERALGVRVLDEAPLEGGASAAVHRLTVSEADDVVLQRFVLDWVRDEPWIPANEVRVLNLLTESPLPTPRVLACDLEGAQAGCPTVVMTALPGAVVWRPDDVDAWLDGLVNVACTVHAVPAAPGLLDWAPYEPLNCPPSWSRSPGAWVSALDCYHGPQPTGDRVFVHRDFHPGNVLWVDGRVGGVVDWVSACIGPPEADIAHCRLNLARSHGQSVADDFLTRWLNATGRPSYDPYFDLVTAVSMADEPDPALDDFVITAARRR